MPTKDKEKLRKYRNDRARRKREALRHAHGQMGLFAKQHVNEKKQRRRAVQRMEALEKLGGKCVRCGWTDERALEIDHIHRLESGSRQYRHLKARYRAIMEGTLGPDELQVLCANCHRIKTRENQEHRAIEKRQVMRSPNPRTYDMWVMRVWLNCAYCREPFLCPRKTADVRKFCSSKCNATNNSKVLKVWRAAYVPGVQTRKKDFMKVYAEREAKVSS